MTSHYPNTDQSQPNSDLPAAGAAALKAYLDTCEKNAIVPDVGGAWANAFRAGADYAAQAMATQAGPATWDLIEQLVQLECSRERLHMEYMGKAMPADVYLRFQKLRDERIPALRAQLHADLAATERMPLSHEAARKLVWSASTWSRSEGVSEDDVLEVIAAVERAQGIGATNDNL
ncbi:hypothetical protein M2375_000893 [Comamonas sp. BIGb0152]|uniref:hypothetical protein n=1 Tax=Comamonas sp. BIGb0152 TaxID=2940601 RepID=UPI002166F78D|nr:hypothetical protein [Comamonas sp. BIGb0152]MCS4292687.1 hypothetical protein [Comamonas sp. BIGb0152]